MVTVATMTRLNMGLVLKSEPIATNCLEDFVSCYDGYAPKIDSQLNRVPSSQLLQVGEALRNHAFLEH